MPGYGKRMEKYAPESTNEVQDVEQRFVMPALPKLSLVQLVIVVMIAAYAWSTRKTNRALSTTLMVALALFHTYDHLYRVKRGDERLFFFPEAKKEGYCSMCQK